MKKVKLVAIGYGNRTRKYLEYIEKNSEEVSLAAVVEIEDKLLSIAQNKFGLDHSVCFHSVDDFFSADIEADGVIIGTPDHTHYELAMKSIQHGYHILLEKPIAQTWKECQEIYQAAKEKNLLVVVCYVLRYHPYYQKIKELLSEKRLGPIISINHVVNVGIDHMAHSYVRGIWANEKESNPIILSKCCHDLDLILWLSGKKPLRINSYGSLRWFKEENAPAGSSMRCSNCTLEKSCPFSAVDLYLRRREWISNFIVPNGSTLDKVLEEEMQEGPYGRCVYHCNNDVMDNQVVSMLLEDQITTILSMNCFTLKDNRNLDIKCVYGEINAVDDRITVEDLRSRKKETYDYTSINQQPLHAYADLKIIEDFVNSIQKGAGENTPTLERAIESHMIGFYAEKSRLEDKLYKID